MHCESERTHSEENRRSQIIYKQNNLKNLMTLFTHLFRLCRQNVCQSGLMKCIEQKYWLKSFGESGWFLIWGGLLQAHGCLHLCGISKHLAHLPLSVCGVWSAVAIRTVTGAYIQCRCTPVFVLMCSNSCCSLAAKCELRPATETDIGVHLPLWLLGIV